MFNSPGFSVGSGAWQSTSVDGIADTGTTLLLLPDSVVKAYYAEVSGSKYDSEQGGYTYPCSPTPPDFHMGVGDGSIVIPGKYINYATISQSRSSSTCYGGIQSNSGIGFSIFGDIALKSAFVVFDAQNMQIGWASKKLN